MQNPLPHFGGEDFSLGLAGSDKRLRDFRLSVAPSLSRLLFALKPVPLFYLSSLHADGSMLHFSQYTRSADESDGCSSGKADFVFLDYS